ncbi:hypothetical protein H2Y56_03410 [Pectobacterium aroidearum]|uniref:CdiI immunity protein domain-containing protein n=1 Tax=Pectobacterium aroidearum TaxID=1201031 RepID=A0ABR5Z9B8_9GAMM|nr:MULTISPECIES: hypothetical protein [Pectobacterium]MBA5198375.1 hypothetical protein [Pectobacterium aroidearum]MBA5227121.1 hypothetical protein [Pectobacterium aroidearum]MBA5231168.1 hypothetical protein [Pectobacterium aroidearum]MBA5736314.1 hypothetical protein [Pectobacterium aroidearum]UXK02453.1 hypothetical protein N5056_11080 [Pectobacterium aroidearum]
MGASIFFRRDETIEKPEDRLTSAFIHSSYWDAFGELLDTVFLPDHPELHEIIKSEEGEYLKFYSFVELDKVDFNQAVKLIRDYIAKQKNPTEWQNMANTVWKDVAEPYIIQDERYDVNA